MNFSLKPHPLVAHWVPGFTVAIVLALGYCGWDVRDLLAVPSGSGPAATISIFVVTILAFVLGEVIDSFRDVLESLLDKLDEVHWDFFFWCTGEEQTNLEESYFTWYAFNANLALGLIAALLLLGVCTLVGVVPRPTGLGVRTATVVVALSLASVFVLAKDAMVLRKEIARLTRKWHENEMKKTDCRFQSHP
jgi:hypothetical protein